MAALSTFLAYFFNCADSKCSMKSCQGLLRAAIFSRNPNLACQKPNIKLHVWHDNKCSFHVILATIEFILMGKTCNIRFVQIDFDGCELIKRLLGIVKQSIGSYQFRHVCVNIDVKVGGNTRNTRSYVLFRSFFWK